MKVKFFVPSTYMYVYAWKFLETGIATQRIVVYRRYKWFFMRIRLESLKGKKNKKTGTQLRVNIDM